MQTACHRGSSRKADWMLSSFWLLASGLPAWFVGTAAAEPFAIQTPGGPVTVQVSPVGPSPGAMAAPNPATPDFRPPAIFSAPLRSGSGGRALALSGAFTAVADDATAASWNPAGLLQLESPEASIVVRASRAENRHSSSHNEYVVGEDTYDNLAINFMSYVQPVRLLDLNFVFSLSYQEDYDFTHRFHAKSRDSMTSSIKSAAAESFSQTTTESYAEDSTVFPGGENRIDVTSDMATRQRTTHRERTSSRLASSIDFEQEGVIDAITLAGAAEITPAFALGAAFNVHADNLLGDNPIRSRTTTRYSGTSTSEAWMNTRRTTTGTYIYDGVVYIPPGGMIPFPIEVPISGAGDYDPIEDYQSQHAISTLQLDGVYEEINEFSDLRGFNATLGAHWTTGSFLTLGFALDLPWTAKAEQNKTIRNRVTTTTSAAGAGRVTTTQTEERETRDVEFDFPRYASLGALMRWTDRFYTTIDASQTQWSEFTYSAAGQGTMNPLDGTPSGEHRLDDCWAVRNGAEYLLPMRLAHIAFRGGLFWEQRPAIGSPDDYYGCSLGLGVSLGQERQVVLDLAWLHTLGNDVMGSLVPGQSGLATDVAYDEVYVSAIYQF